MKVIPSVYSLKCPTLDLELGEDNAKNYIEVIFVKVLLQTNHILE
jgi:hypothetical protein